MASEEPDTDLCIGKKFGYMVQAIQGALPESTLKDFAKLKTDPERFAFAWNLQPVHDVIVLEKEWKKKSSKVARKYREKGKEYFMKKSYLSALTEYNNSVMMAPVSNEDENNEEETVLKTGSENSPNQSKVNEEDTGKSSETIEDEKQDLDDVKKELVPDKHELALAYGNRSATLLHLKKYKACLTDIEFALEHGYPQDMQYKLFERMGKCHTQLGNRSEAIKSFQRAKDTVILAGLKEKAHKTVVDSLDQQLKKCDEITPPDNVVEAPQAQNHFNLPALTRTEDSNSLSNKVKVSYARGIGKHLVALDDIKSGEVLVVEKPFVSVIFPDYQPTHCNECFIPITVPIPCLYCRSAAYCSRDCRDKSWNSFHQYECSLYTLIDPSMCGKIGHLAVRLLMKIGLDALLDHVKKHETLCSQETSETIHDKIILPDYDYIYNLITNVDERKQEETFHFAVVACFFIKLLKLAGFMTIIRENSPKEFDLIGGVLLRHLQITQCNAWKITELQKPDKFDNLKPDGVGIGLYPLAASINHACDPNADFNFFDDVLVLRAIRNIYKDEEVCISYGPLFHDIKQIPRQNQLRKMYLFNCKCTACKEQWPVVQEMFDSVPGYSCVKCRALLNSDERVDSRYFKCTKCDHKQDMEEVVGCLQASFDTFAEAMVDALGGRSVDALPKFHQHQDLLQRYLRHPWRDLVACQEAVKNCYRLQANIKV